MVKSGYESGYQDGQEAVNQSAGIETAWITTCGRGPRLSGLGLAVKDTDEDGDGDAQSRAILSTAQLCRGIRDSSIKKDMRGTRGATILEKTHDSTTLSTETVQREHGAYPPLYKPSLPPKDPGI